MCKAELTIDILDSVKVEKPFFMFLRIIYLESEIFFIDYDQYRANKARNSTGNENRIILCSG